MRPIVPSQDRTWAEWLAQFRGTTIQFRNPDQQILRGVIVDVHRPEGGVHSLRVRASTGVDYYINALTLVDGLRTLSQG